MSECEATIDETTETIDLNVYAQIDHEFVLNVLDRTNETIRLLTEHTKGPSLFEHQRYFDSAVFCLAKLVHQTVEVATGFAVTLDPPEVDHDPRH